MEKFSVTKKLLENYVTYLYEEERCPATVEKYERDIRHFMNFVGEGKEITREIMISYKQSLLKEYQVSSANSMLAAVNQYLQYIGAHCMKVKRVKVQRSIYRDEERDLTEQEYKDMVQKAYQNGNIRLALIMETICSTGIRISELKYFTVHAVKVGKVQIHNKGKIRIILIPQVLQKKLLCYISRQKIDKGSVFVTAGGKPVDRSNVWREMKNLGLTINLLSKKIFPHNLRHLFAKLYYRAYNDIIGLADILGHSSVETTRMYTATTGEEYRYRMEKLRLVS